MTAVIMAALEHWQCKQIVFCATIYRQEGLSVIHPSMLEPWLSHQQPQTWLSQRQEVYHSYTCIFIFTHCHHWFKQMDASLKFLTLINTLLLSVCTEQSEWVLTGNGASSSQVKSQSCQGLVPAWLLRLDRVCNFLFCFLDRSPLSYLLFTFLRLSPFCFLPLLRLPLVPTLTFVFYVCVYCQLLSAVHFPWCI